MTAVEMMTEDMESHSRAECARTKHLVVVATDGSEAALSAFAAAALIAEKCGSAVHVLTVLEPLPVLVPLSESVLIRPDIENNRAEGQRRKAQEQMAGFSGSETWRIETKFGRAADVIAQYGKDNHADLIIIGSHKHGMIGRLLGDETAIEIARLSEVPLLVAAPELKRLPKRVMVAMDIRTRGLGQLPEVLSLLTQNKSISCVHVKPRADVLGIDGAGFDKDYEFAMQSRFREVSRMLDEVGIRPDLIALHGDVTYELADFASYSKAELLVVGINRRPGRRRAIGGRLAARMLRRADCSVLIVPAGNSRLAETTGIPGATTDVLRDSALWPEALRGFTARNAGRLVTLEVDDPEIGALVEATSYPLLGVDYDHKDGRLTISFGATKGTAYHLTRSIAHPESVSILSVAGRDRALSVAHGKGQSLLSFPNGTH